MFSALSSIAEIYKATTADAAWIDAARNKPRHPEMIAKFVGDRHCSREDRVLPKNRQDEKVLSLHERNPPSWPELHRVSLEARAVNIYGEIHKRSWSVSLGGVGV
jgi:hypothetical protein